jgi:hypothetical protein
MMDGGEQGGVNGRLLIALLFGEGILRSARAMSRLVFAASALAGALS